jgi:type I restriction enzyme M protein
VPSRSIGFGDSSDKYETSDETTGKVGYEINFNRYFYKYQPARPLAEIERDIKAVEQDILKLLREVAG